MGLTLAVFLASLDLFAPAAEERPVPPPAAPAEVVVETNAAVEAVVEAAVVTSAPVEAVAEDAPGVSVQAETVAETNVAAAAVATNAVPAAATATNEVSRLARITAERTYFDRKEGIVRFDRHVHVDDDQYQLWADRAYVFLSGTNDLKRIVALGNVALTNETRRAYGDKASYYREAGMVVLYAPPGGVAEVRDETPEGTRSVTGNKIKFWIDSEQVEVIGASITAPVSSKMKGDFSKNLRR